MAADIFVELKATTGEFMAKMGEARTEIDKLGGKGATMSKLSSVGKAAFFGLAGSALAVGGIALKFADDWEAARTRLEGAVANMGGSFDELKPRIDRLDGAMARFGYTNADVEGNLAMLTNATHNPTQAMNLMGLAADVAKGRNIALSDATQILVRVQTGHASSLGRLGIRIKDASGHMLSQQQILAELSNTYKGDAARASETLGGKTAAVRAQMQNLAAQLGSALAPALLAVVSIITNVVGWFERHRAAAVTLAAVIGGAVVVAIGAWVASMFAADGALAGLALTVLGVETAGAPLLLMLAAVVAAVALVAFAAYELATHWSTVWGAIKGAAEAAWHFLRDNVFRPIWEYGLLPIRVYVDLLKLEWRLAWTAISDVAKWAWSSVLKPTWDALSAAMRAIGTALSWVYNNVWQPVWHAFTTVLGMEWSAMKKVFAFVSAAVSAVGTALSWMYTNVWTPVWAGMQAVVQDVWNFLKPIFDAVGRGIGGVANAASKVAGFVGGAASHLIPHFAAGTSFAGGGLSLVGERGPEIADLPRGARIINGDRTARMLGGGGGDVYVTVQTVVDGQIVRESMQKADRQYQARNGRNSWGGVSAPSAA